MHDSYMDFFGLAIDAAIYRAWKVTANHYHIALCEGYQHALAPAKTDECPGMASKSSSKCLLRLFFYNSEACS